jgi:hypothetical protein
MVASMAASGAVIAGCSASTNRGNSTQYKTSASDRTAPAPTVSGISPTSSPTAGGTSVTITGTGLNGTTKVTFWQGGCYQLRRRL